MACFSPVDAWRTTAGEIVFRETGYAVSKLELPCGRCVGCLMERARSWSVRIVHEASLHADNCFVTLTFRDAKVSLDYRDFQLFLKRLRKAAGFFDVTLWQWLPRFFVCGEYGSLRGRPHYHAILFGLNFPDRVFDRLSPAGERLYRSAQLEELWPDGFSSIGDVTEKSAAYVARYVTKKLDGPGRDDLVDLGTGELSRRVPEFVRMSRRPGVGALWIQRFSSDVLSQDCVRVGSDARRPPKYYSAYLRENFPVRFAEIEVARRRKALAGRADGTPERLRVREVVAKARLAVRKRVLE